MADQKKWFKVWASILNDDKFNNMGLENVGRWTLLGALICQQGERGKLQVTPPATLLLLWFKVPDFEALKMSLNGLPNVTLMDVLDGHGAFVVTMRNWYKYQVDATHAERKRRARAKRRGEEKLTSTSSPSRTRSVETTRVAQEDENGTSGGVSFSEQVKRLREGRLTTRKD
jgi:hypothetical protein